MITLSFIEVAYLSMMLILTSFTAGFVSALFFSSNKENKSALMLKYFAIMWSLTWALFTGWSLFTQGQTVSVIYDAAGLTVVAFVFGRKAGEKAIDQVTETVKKVKDLNK